ncbi:hypothetical protein GCM10010112_57090 [Actinoplanes lobatus]|uniref:YcxB-like protein domain-containing protein n=1 Tax=Actinoplanes lobatus TaxID=113568 RepID=A0A7W7HCG1_9ACTN|nr:YcxB family protein [Actinoplanes lobatus]MBB4747972.1 hypothetical protein [Actinoplanes lobatus]GGN81055.1 hypothetical protein GCM10010112_57090 [Actinoplanes lobatus]GIE41561.1 hypothetical protein Alo02nite_44590 [Actinoplanes lobatus]
MQIQFTAVSDPVLIAAATRRRLRRPVLMARLGGWLLLLAATLLLAVTGDLDPVLLAVGAGLAVLVPAVLLNGTVRTFRPGQLTTYEITEGGVASSSPESRHAYAWRAFRSVDELSGQLLFSLRGARFVPVPTAGLSPGQIEQVLSAASAGGLRVHRR